MASQGVSTAPGERGSERRVGGWWQVWRGALLLMLIAVALGTLAFGSHRASFDDLKDQLQHHAISHLRVEGALPAGASGNALVRVKWRAHGVTRFTQIEQASSRSQLDQGLSDGSADERTGRVVGDVDSQLRHYDPDVQITHRKDVTGLSGTVVFGWQIPAALALLTAFVWALTIGSLVNGPEPRLATKWAWGWGLVSPVTLLVIPLYLLTAAPWRGGSRAPSGKRLTGGWAFLLLVVCAGGIASKWIG